MIDENGHDWKDNEVVCALELFGDGSAQWEMSCPATAECIEYFATKKDAESYAKRHKLTIVEWIKE